MHRETRSWGGGGRGEYFSKVCYPSSYIPLWSSRVILSSDLGDVFGSKLRIFCLYYFCFCYMFGYLFWCFSKQNIPTVSSNQYNETYAEATLHVVFPVMTGMSLVFFCS